MIEKIESYTVEDFLKFESEHEAYLYWYTLLDTTPRLPPYTTPRECQYDWHDCTPWPISIRYQGCQSGYKTLDGYALTAWAGFLQLALLENGLYARVYRSESENQTYLKTLKPGEEPMPGVKLG